MSVPDCQTSPPAAATGLPCVVCGGTRHAPLYRVLEQCGDCGFIWADANVSEADIQRLYREDYFRGQEYGDYLADRAVFRKNFGRRFAEITRLAGRLESVFEIGCAYGFWLEVAAENGVRSAGVDLCAEATDYAARTLKQNATSEDFLQKPIRPGEYQAFCMWDTIEHLPRPDLFVERAFELLPPGGWFFATTGDIGSKLARRRGPRWRMIHPPTHLQYFSTDTMRRFLERRGFEVVSIRSTPMYRSLRGTLGGLMALGKGLPKHAARLASAVIPGAVQDKLGFWLDLGDIMLAAARKP